MTNICRRHFKCISWLKLSQLWSFSLKCIAMDWTDNMSSLIHVMVCRLFGNECRLSVSQCWPRFMTQFGVTRPQSIKCVNPRSSIISWEILWAFLANIRYHLFCANISRQRNTGQTRSYFVANTTLENRYGFWPQTGCVTVPGCEAAFLVARQRFPCHSRFNFLVKNMENMLPCNAICDTMHIYFSRKIYCGANDASIGF